MKQLAKLLLKLGKRLFSKDLIYQFLYKINISWVILNDFILTDLT